MTHKIIVGDSWNPWSNLALEELIMDSHQGGVTLYLWQNQNTVVIGRNQNAWGECRLDVLERDGGKLARRSSGGGAVFHDLGNLNFTFVAERELYDVRRQLSVIQRAIGDFGIDTEFTGRNDLVLKETGEKFSGNAFWMKQDRALHHGTLLLDVDLEKMGKYLAPPKAKLEAKGVKSVRARVCNLKQKAPDMDIQSIKQALQKAFCEEYGPAEQITPEAYDAAERKRLEEKYSSWQWRMGRSPKCDVSLAKRFAWGGVKLLFTLKNGAIEELTAYSDSMDEAIAEKLTQALQGARFVQDELAERVACIAGGEYEEMSQWLREAEL